MDISIYDHNQGDFYAQYGTSNRVYHKMSCVGKVAVF